MIHPNKSLWKLHHRLYGRFSSNPRSKTGFYNLGRELNCAYPLFKRALTWWDAMYRVRESKSKLELFYRMFIKLYCHIFLGPGLEYMFERALKLSLHIPKICSAFQVLKCFIFYFLRLLASFLHAQQILTCDRLSQRALLSLGKAVVSHLKLKAWLN